jgi:hypothetical protein
MSAWGQSRHFDRAAPTSGLARLADILRVIRQCLRRAMFGHVATATFVKWQLAPLCLRIQLQGWADDFKSMGPIVGVQVRGARVG